MLLNPIIKTDSWILGTLLFVAFLLLALAKRLEPKILRIIFQSFFTLGTPESTQKFEARFDNTSFILIGFHFFISLWVCSTLFIQQHDWIDNEVVFGLKVGNFNIAIVTLLINLFLFVYNFLGLYISFWLTGERTIINTFISQSWINILPFGILFFALGLIWLLNPSLSDELYRVFIYVFIIFYALRFIKLFIASLSEGIPWYYIILYLCTLEILPVVVILYAVV